MLAAMAERLQEAIGGDAIAARFSEHSLAVLMRGNDYAQTTALAARILEAFALHVFQIGNRSSVITASIGGVQIGEQIATAPQLLAKANQGLKSSSGLGGHRFAACDPTAAQRAREET